MRRDVLFAADLYWGGTLSFLGKALPAPGASPALPGYSLAGAWKKWKIANAKIAAVTLLELLVVKLLRRRNG